MRLVLFPLLIVLYLTCSLAAEAPEGENDGEDKSKLCASWAEKGECVVNPEYMKKACPNACVEALKHKEALIKEVEGIKSIHELSAKDIHGNVVKFSDYKGYVVVFTNVIAADNMMSEAHYKGLLQLQERVKNQKVKFFLFPTEQFVHEKDELPEDKDDLLAYFTNKGLLDEGSLITVMEPIKVNGPDSHIVYKWAKYDAAPPVHGIAWNFDPYFLVHPKGDLESRHRLLPEQLFEFIMEHFGSSEL